MASRVLRPSFPPKLSCGRRSAWLTVGAAGRPPLGSRRSAAGLVPAPSSSPCPYHSAPGCCPAPDPCERSSLSSCLADDLETALFKYFLLWETRADGRALRDRSTRRGWPRAPGGPAGGGLREERQPEDAVFPSASPTCGPGRTHGFRSARRRTCSVEKTRVCGILRHMPAGARAPRFSSLRAAPNSNAVPAACGSRTPILGPRRLHLFLQLRAPRGGVLATVLVNVGAALRGPLCSRDHPAGRQRESRGTHAGPWGRLPLRPCNSSTIGGHG